MAEVYKCEINTAPPLRQWVYHKAAWARDDLEQGLGLFYVHWAGEGWRVCREWGVGMTEVVEDLLHVTSGT